MSGRIGQIASSLRADRGADAVVPPSGFTVGLTLATAAAMAFLAVFTLALAASAGRIADRWGEELARASTLRISAPAGERAAQTEAALRVLRTTPGIVEVRALSQAEQAALVAPWLGDALPLDTLPMPQLIEIIETEDGYDGAGLRLRLAAEVPAAVLDDHARWRRPLVDAAGRLRLLGWVSTLLIAAATGAMVTLAASAALAANAQVIRVLRLVGATDAYIARAFVRRYTLRALMGAALGAGLATLAVLFLPDTAEGGLLTGIGFAGVDWVWPFLVPVLTAAVAFAATLFAARRTLKEMP